MLRQGRHERMRNWWFCMALLAILGAGCAWHGDASRVMAWRGVGGEGPGKFRVCANFGCDRTVIVSLSADQWGQVRGVFTPFPSTAQEERERAAVAVGLLERLAGAQAGTDVDTAENGLLGGTGQLDCIAEALNTTVYLSLMAKDGLLPHHVVEAPARRGFAMIFPHNTAVLRDTTTGESWAVDSWFRDNGESAHVVPLKTWRNYWEPDEEINPEEIAAVHPPCRAH